MSDGLWPGGTVRVRSASRADAERIAMLHADSWRRHYRGAYADEFLDGDVVADRRAVWSERLAQRGDRTCTLVAEEDDELLGFAHTIFDDDSAWGALVDNVHVVHTHKRRGIGTRLLARSAAEVAKGSGGLYLWVLEQNVDAQAFYRSCGGSCVGRRAVSSPGGVPGRLCGSPVGLRYVWPDPFVLIALK
jgi:GNAT superfamily N-acetyltransferase